MTKLVSIRKPFVWSLVLCVMLGLSACHADPDDAAGQAQELSDAVRREYALGNLARGPALVGLDLADGDDGATDLLGQRIASEIERATAPANPVAE